MVPDMSVVFKETTRLLATEDFINLHNTQYCLVGLNLLLRDFGPYVIVSSP
jgi:hypothetical protein